MAAANRGFAAALASAKPITKSVRICLDGDLLARADVLGEQLVLALAEDERENRTPQAPLLKEQIDQVTAQIRAAEVEFVFRSIGRLAWRDLIAAHPPEKQHRELGADFNTETFPVAAMAAACVSPEGADLEGFERLAEAVTDGQWNRLWVTCHEANTAGGVAPNLAAAFALARPTETS